MHNFEKGQRVKVISNVYKDEGILLGQYGRIVNIGKELYEVEAETPNDPNDTYPWCFYEHEIEAVEE